MLRILFGGCLFGLLLGAAAVYWMASAAQMIKVRRSVTRLRHSLENRTGVHISVRMSEGGVGNLVNIDSRVHEMGVLAKASSAIVYEHIHKLWRRNLDKPEGAADPRAVPPNADKGGPDKEVGGEQHSL